MAEGRGELPHTTSASTATATSTNKERGNTKAGGQDEEGRTCRSRWKGEIIVGARDSHAKHPLYLESASQESGTTAMHP